MQLALTKPLTLVRTDLKGYVESIDDVKNQCVAIYKNSPDDDKPEIEVIDDGAERDQITLRIKPQKRYKIMFEGSAGKVLSKQMTEQACFALHAKLNAEGNVKISINNRVHIFTKYMFRGMEETKPILKHIPLTLTEAEVERRKNNTKKLYQLGQAAGINLEKAKQDNLNQKKSDDR